MLFPLCCLFLLSFSCPFVFVSKPLPPDADGAVTPPFPPPSARMKLSQTRRSSSSSSSGRRKSAEQGKRLVGGSKQEKRWQLEDDMLFALSWANELPPYPVGEYAPFIWQEKQSSFMNEAFLVLPCPFHVLYGAFFSFTPFSAFFFRPLVLPAPCTLLRAPRPVLPRFHRATAPLAGLQHVPVVQRGREGQERGGQRPGRRRLGLGLAERDGAL